VRRDQVKTAGWLRHGDITIQEALPLFNELGSVDFDSYTDIEKDGVLQGPNFEKLSMVLANSRARVILSGGVSQISDIEKCCAIRAATFEGVIIGKALYDKRFQLSDAVAAYGIKGERHLMDKLMHFWNTVLTQRDWSWAVIGIAYLLVFLVIRSFFLHQLIKTSRALNSSVS